MINLDVKKLTSCNSDWESNQYTVLSRVREWEKHFRKNRLYPYLNESIDLHLSLKDILKENLESKWWLQREFGLRGMNERYIVYEKAQQVSQQLDLLIDFVEWSLKLNKQVMEEGMILKEFIQDNLKIKQVNDEPNYRGKGYFSIPDNNKQVLNIYIYDLKWDWGSDETGNSLQIKPVRSIPLSLIKKDSLHLMKEFIEQSQPLYKPMAYVFNHDLDFPFTESIYPIAEEMLLNTIMV